MVRHLRALRPAALPLLALLIACGDATGSGRKKPDPEPEPEPKENVSAVELRSVTDVAVGDSAHFVAVVLDTLGFARTGAEVEWSSSAPGVATAAGGVVTGVSAGTATIRAKSGSKEATAEVRVGAPWQLTIVGPGSPLIFDQPVRLNNAGVVLTARYLWKDGVATPFAADFEAWDLNDAGQVAGTARTGDPARPYAAVRWENGDTTILYTGPDSVPAGTPMAGTPRPVATAINEHGDVAGFWLAGMDARHWTMGGFVVRGGTTTGLPLGYIPLAMAGDGTVAGRTLTGRYGYYWEAQGAFRWKAGELASLTYGSGAFDVNEAGAAAGWGSSAAYGLSGLVWGAEGSRALPGWPEALALALNDAGDVVGTAGTVDLGTIRGHDALLWRGERRIRLNAQVGPSRWVLRRATGINEDGWIVGYAVDPVTHEEAVFLLEPPGS